MLFGCITLLLTCEQLESYDFLLNDNATLLHVSTHNTVAIAYNTTLSLALQYPHVFYVAEFANVDTVYKYDMESEEATEIATNFLSISGLAVFYPTLYVLEMGDYNIDPSGRITAVSLTTGKQKVLLRIKDSSPRALYMDDINGFLYYSLSNGSVIRFNIASSEVSLVTSSYDVWATGLCVENNILYIYNSRTLYTHDITAGNTVDVKNVGDWNTLAVSGSSLCIVENMEWSDDDTLSISTKNTTSTLHLNTTSSLLALLLFHNISTTSPTLAKCQGCDVCLGVELECGCRFGGGVSTPCRTAPKDYLLLTQVQTLSLLDLFEPDNIHRLHINTNQWWMRDVVFDSRSGTIFWVESVFVMRTSPSNMEAVDTRVMRMQLNDVTTRHVVYSDHNKRVDTLTLNAEDGLLYWLVREANLLVAAKVSCTTQLCYKTTLVNQDLKRASKLEVSGKTGYMVYVSGENQIIRRDLDGANSKVILSANILQISCIALSGQSVYILTSSDGSIISLPLAGGEQTVVYRQSSEFIPLSVVAVSRDLLFVVSEFKRTVLEVNLSSQTSEPILKDFKGLKSIASNSAGVTGHCSKNTGGCDHFCFSLPNANHRCGCADGFILAPDNITCEEPPLVYLSVGSWIQRFHPFPVSGNSSLENVVFHSGAEIVAFDYFEEKECLVWINAKRNTISKTYLKGEQLPTDKHLTIVIDGLVKPTDISVDWLSNTVYWSDQLRDTISMVSLDGSLRKVVVEFALSPTSLVVYPVNGAMYWIGWEPDTAVIRSSMMDGSNVTTLVSRLSTWPTDITIDYQNSRVVWVDAKDSLVVSSQLDGTDIRYILGTNRMYMRYPLSLAVWHGYTYWADHHMSSVYVAEGSNSFDVKPVMSMLVDVTDMVLSHPGKQERRSTCYPGNGNCSHICVPTSVITRVCMCPLRMFLGSDSLTCRESAQQMIGVDLNPYLLSVASPPTRLSHQRLGSAVKIAVHYAHQSIYWLDNDRSSIEKVHVNGTGYKTVYKGTYHATDIRVDWMGGNIYWTESDSKSLKCVTLNGEYEKLVLLTKAAPMFLLIDPPKSKLFWVECESDSGALYQSAMSGSNVRLILNTTKCPESVDIARETMSIYWNIGDYLYQYLYDIEQVVAPRALPFPTTGNEKFCTNLPEPTTKCVRVPTPKIVWVEETLFVRREREEEGRRRREMVGIDTLVERIIDLGNSSCFVAFSPLDTGFSECHINNGGCTHFCYYEENSVTCGCPAQQTLLSNNKTCTKLEVECAEEEFRCGSGECISEVFVCSSHSECLDHSDETDCGWCPSYEFSCGLKCIPSTLVCDGARDCEDGEDDNPAMCSSNAGYICKGTGMSLPSRMRCNGVKECEHGDDEKKCPRMAVECNGLEWRCESEGSCIQASWLCDEYPDCPGGEDEQGCPECDPTTEFDCGNAQCISKADVCDGYIHCYQDGRDEANCDVCKKGQKLCHNGQCRAANRWCDRTPDCSDRSDEWNCNYTIVEPKGRGKQNHIAPTLIIIFVSLLMSMVVVGILYKFNILPRVRSTYKELTQSSNKTVETNVCVTTNTYSELETTVCSSDGAWQRRNNKSLDHYETITNSSISSCLKPINTQNPYERFGIIPVQSTTDVSIGDGPPPSIASGGYSSGPGPSSRAPSARSRALSARSRATSARSRVPMAYHVNSNVVWDDHINSVSDYDQNYLSDNYQSEFSVGFPGSRPETLSTSLAPGCGTPITTDNDD